MRRADVKKKSMSMLCIDHGCCRFIHSCGAKPLSVWVRAWLGKTEYQWLLPKLRNVCPIDSQDTDVYLNNEKAVGLTFSYLVGSWYFSFPVTNSLWLAPSITATECRLEGDDIIERVCVIKHLANGAHATHWRHLRC